MPPIIEWIGRTHSDSRHRNVLLIGFDTGIPGICDECFKEKKPSVRYYCEHNKRLAVFQDGYWETVRDAGPDEIENC